MNNNPCQNSGTCINSNGGFHCICPPGVSGIYCSDVMSKTSGVSKDFALKLEEMIGIILGSLFMIVFIVIIYVGCKRFKTVVKNGRNSNGGTYHIQNDFDKDTMAMQRIRNSDYNNREQKLNNLELAAQDSRPLIPATRPMSSFMHNQHETAFNYAETVRSYGSAADELETATLPRLPHDYIQNIQKPMAAVAPSVCCHPSDQIQDGGVMLLPHHSQLQDRRNLMDSYFFPTKPGGKRSPPRPTSFRPPSRVRANVPASATDSPGLKGATSLSSLPTSNIEDTQKYYWDSFDLNGTEEPEEQHPSLIPEVNAGTEIVDNSSFVSSESNENNLLLMNPTKSAASRLVDPTRDIDTLPEDETTVCLISNNNGDDVISTAGTEDEPQLGAVYPQAATSNSLEQLLSLNEDINFADDDDDEGHEAQNSYDYHLHLNNYLPQHNISEASETDEQTPMLGRKDNQYTYQGLSATTSPNSNFNRCPPSPIRIMKPDADPTADHNRYLATLPEDPFRNKPVAIAPPNSLRLANYNSLGLASTTTTMSNADVDNLCELEDSDCETPTVEIKSTAVSNLPRVTQV